MKSGSLNLLEPSGPHWACYRTALPLPLPLFSHLCLCFSGGLLHLGLQISILHAFLISPTTQLPYPTDQTMLKISSDKLN